MSLKLAKKTAAKILKIADELPDHEWASLPITLLPGKTFPVTDQKDGGEKRVNKVLEKLKKLTPEGYEVYWKFKINWVHDRVEGNILSADMFKVGKTLVIVVVLM